MAKEITTPDCCELVAIMEGTIKDEEEGSELYDNMIENLFMFKGKDPTVDFFQEVLGDMAKDEKRHARYLKAISSVLGDFCKCK